MWQFWIDRGGTFTDVVARRPDGQLVTAKLLSENPGLYADAAIAGIKTVLGIPLSAAIPSGLVKDVKLGTTVATNALLQRRGARVLLVVNRGFADLLVIGNQVRPRLFDLNIRRPPALYEAVVEIAGRIGQDGEQVEALDEAAALAAFKAAYALGLRACAIALMHAWKYPAHECRLGELAYEAGFTHVSTSHTVSPRFRLVPRADTTLVDAYVSTLLRSYVDHLVGELADTRLSFMQSNGGLTDAAKFHGKDAILSGPAGGIVGAARTAEAAGFPRVITFDMGGTSTDVALYEGSFERSFETQIAGVRMQTPMMAINTVAAGGGSVLHFDGARMRVGPDSAGADPGPACYRRGGPLTVTDANVCVGKLQPAHFPALFGMAGDEALDAETVQIQFTALAEELAKGTGDAWNMLSTAEGFIQIAVANMANAIKQVSVQKGRDPSKFVLQCFGGAGGQHACLVADELGMQTVFIHPLAGVLSAYGMGLADRTILREHAVECALADTTLPVLRDLADQLLSDAKDALLSQGADGTLLQACATLHLRYAGTEASLPVPLGPLAAMEEAFASLHRARFGFATPGRALMAETLTVEATLPGPAVHQKKLSARISGSACPIDSVSIFTGGIQHRSPVFERETLLSDDRIDGPALVREANATTVIEPGWTAHITPAGGMVLHRTTPRAARAETELDRPDAVLLELFGNLFTHVAEQTGIVLRNTSMSVNIRERLDFSCAIFTAEGALIANAPHVPVHLGAMGESVRSVVKTRGATLKHGDVVALNNPYNGGTHLPDITVITPVFAPDGALVFFTANRGHHADIGGATPGSTPPFSRTLEEEGVVIDNFLLVEGGHFREAAFRTLLNNTVYPARNTDVNVADIKAQIAANAAGIRELQDVIDRHGWPTVQAYMRHVMTYAEACVRRVIDRIGDGIFTYTMDDGAVLCVAVSVDRASRSARVDFTGTGSQRSTNFNAPRAVTRAAVLYVFRCLVNEDIPLNDGCLAPIDIVIPPGTFLSPEPGAAVVAGNTEVSQAVTSALFGALSVQACSQSTMNNFLFGDSKHQYYETICGGAGAGPLWHGAPAVHTHMTNTRMTDPEVLEMRYPVRLETFAIRNGSGGLGQHRGGDGAIRRIRFLHPMTAVLVSSRRTHPPFGLAGGEPGAPGQQRVERADGTIERLPGVCSVQLSTDDVFTIETPGGGGFGGSPGYANIVPGARHRT